MDSKYNAIRGLRIKSGFYKSVHKGEDAWLQKPGISLENSNCGALSLDIYGVFDGHGGKQAATYASRNVTDKLLASLKEKLATTGSSLNAASAAKQDPQLPPEVDRSLRDIWGLQDQITESLPESLADTFDRLQEDFFQQTKVSGTTATVAALVGWQLLVANVGDSCAYLDTGSEVLQMSGNHRLDDSKAEQERIRSQGYELSSSKLEGRPCGPLRVWPGGLAMGRTLGDFEAGDIVLSAPEVRQATLPATGARLIMASDGLWDSVAPKTAAHHVRGMPASKAAREVGLAALKGKGLKDDITVLVIDFLPDDDHKLPPHLAKDGSGQLQGSYNPSPPVHIFQPLEDTSAAEDGWQTLQWQRRMEAVRAAFPEPAPEQVQELDSDSASSHSAELLHSQLDSASEPAHSSDESETVHANLQCNPFAIAEDQLNVEGGAGEEVWDVVHSRSREVPAAGKKHALPYSDNSPSATWQVPKALKEAPPSPAFSPMQTSDLSSSATRHTQAPSHARQARGRSRGRGRASAARGRNQAFANHSNPTHSFNGFNVPQKSDSHPAHQSSAPEKEAALGLSFLDGGGFSFQPVAEVLQESPSAPRSEGSFANLDPNQRESKDGRGRGRGVRNAQHRRNQHRRKPQHAGTLNITIDEGPQTRGVHRSNGLSAEQGGFPSTADDRAQTRERPCQGQNRRSHGRMYRNRTQKEPGQNAPLPSGDQGKD